MARSDDWFQQAKKDLLHAKESIRINHFEWSCLAAQQAAEKAIKAVFIERGSEAWGHSLLRLLELLPEENKPSEEVLNAAKHLDKHYVTSRYPNAFAEGAPEDYYTKKDAEESLNHAEKILSFCSDQITALRKGSG